jgi:hypothetical protein
MTRQERIAPLSGIAFVVFFIASIVVSSAPKATDSDSAWVAAYATHAKQAGHLATGILLVLAGLSLASFLTNLWQRVRQAGVGHDFSPLPVVAAGIAAACMAVGGVLMAGASGSALIGSAPLPGADVLRLGDEVGFAMVAVGGMLAAALSVALLAAQARRAGLFGSRLTSFSFVVAVLLLASVAFVPIVALLIWSLVVAVGLLRGSIGRVPAGAATGQPAFR